MRHFGFVHVLTAATLVIVPGTALAVYSLQPTANANDESGNWLPFELGHRSPEHEAPDSPVDTDWAEDTNADQNDSNSSDGPRRSGSDPTAPIVDSLGASGIPDVALRAYVRGQDTTARDDPRCNLRWSLLAAIGRVETNHGRYGGAQLRQDGSGTKPIRGIALDGRPGVALIRDTDNGELDDDATYDRAVGPMQFIPSTWDSVAADGNGDGDQDPDNIFDAALAASLYLCSGNTNMEDEGQLAGAVFRYNRSQEYVDLVLSLAEAYQNGYAPDLPEPGPTKTPTEPLPEPVPDPANEGVPPGLSKQSGALGGGSPSSSTTSTVPGRPRPSTTTTPTATTSPPAPASSTTTTSASTPTTTAPPYPDDPDEPECPDPDDSASAEAEPAEPVDPECCASEPDDADELTEQETTTTSAPSPDDAEADDKLPRECCTDGAGPGDELDGTDTDGEAGDAPVCQSDLPDEESETSSSSPATSAREGTVADRVRREHRGHGRPRKNAHR